MFSWTCRDERPQAFKAILIHCSLLPFRLRGAFTHPQFMFLFEGNTFHKKCNYRVSVGKSYPDTEILFQKKGSTRNIVELCCVKGILDPFPGWDGARKPKGLGTRAKHYFFSQLFKCAPAFLFGFKCVPKNKATAYIGFLRNWLSITPWKSDFRVRSHSWTPYTRPPHSLPGHGALTCPGL